MLQIVKSKLLPFVVAGFVTACPVVCTTVSAAEEQPVQAAVHHSSDFGWEADQNVTEAFAALLNDGTLTAGEELVLDHTYRISGGRTLPDNFTLSAVKGAGLAVTDATVNHKGGRPLLELGDGCTLRNLTITYLNTPELGPTGEKPGVTFSKRVGIVARGKTDLLIENCRLTGSIGHHVRLAGCRKVRIIGTRIAGGHWTVNLWGVSDMLLRRCLIEKCQGDGIKTGGGGQTLCRNIRVENCVFQDNLRDGIDTTGGFNDSVVRNTTFRRMGVSGMDIKSHYIQKNGRIEDQAPENVGILIEKCLFHDMPNGIVLSTVVGPGLLTVANVKTHAPHDIDINDCVFGHAEKPLRPKGEGGYGANYPSEEGEHMRGIQLKDAYDVRYRNMRISGERIRPVRVRSLADDPYWGKKLDPETAKALRSLGGKKSDRITGNLLEEQAPPIKPGVTEVPFACGPA
jgi:hypothetical protein